MKYKAGDKIILKGQSKTEEIAYVQPGEKTYDIGWGVVVSYDMIDHEKTAELQSNKKIAEFQKKRAEGLSIPFPPGRSEQVAVKQTLDSIAKYAGDDTVESPHCTKRKIGRHKDLTDYMHQTYIRKNKDYGDSFSRVHKEIGWQSSLGDIAHKFYRLQNLMQNKGEHHVEGETTIDTLIDLANYSLLLAMELEDE